MGRVSKRAMAVGALAAALFALPARAGEPASEGVRTRTVLESGPLKVGEKVPTFAGWTVSGSLLTLDQILREQPGAVVVSFFATWCKPCKENLPAVVRIAEAFKAKNVRVVLVAYGENADVVKPFLDANGLNVPVILDPFTKIAQRMGVSKALPRTVVLDGRGTVRTLFETEGTDFEGALRLAVLGAADAAPASEKALGRRE